ncbi:MAG: TRAP transporter small permease [Pararhodobacter sp.]
MTMLTRFIVLIGSVVPAVLLGIVLVVVTADVFARNVFQQSIAVSHDVAIVALSGVVWFGIVGIAATGGLFGVQYFVERLPKRWQPFVHGFVHIVIIVIAGAVLQAAIIQVETARFTRFLSLGWPKWIVSAALALAMAMVIVTQLIQLFRLLRGRRDQGTGA